MKFREANIGDIDLYFEWANDPITRKNSYNDSIIEFSIHSEWFKRKLSDPRTWLLIFSNENDNYLGQVRFELNEPATEAVIGISLDIKHRGSGYSSEMLTCACSALFECYPNIKVVANIFITNESSYKAFLKAGFQFQKRMIIKEIESFILSKSL